jgi:hypothetical protein
MREHAYVRGGSYPELDLQHPPKIGVARNTRVDVVRLVGEQLVLVRVPGLAATRFGLDTCLVPRAELSAEPWGDRP